MSLLRKIRRFIQRKETAAVARDRRKLFLEPLEPRVLLSADMQFAMTGDADDVTLRMLDVGGADTLQIVDSTDHVLDTYALTDIDSLEILGTAGDDSFRLDLDFSAISKPIPITFRGARAQTPSTGLPGTAPGSSAAKTPAA
jgi:hypothetical protein